MTRPLAAADTLGVSSGGHHDTSSTTLNRFNTRIEFPVKNSTSNTPALLQKLLSSLTDNFPSILFYTASSDKIDIGDFPRKKRILIMSSRPPLPQDGTRKSLSGSKAGQLSTSMPSKLLSGHYFNSTMSS
jgi:hypothetical protein